MNQATTAAKLDWRAVRDQLLPRDSEKLLPSGWKLPVVPQAVTQFMQHANDSNFDVGRLASIVEQDTSLTCELLKHVNSSAYGMRHRISSVRRALMVLGIRRSKLLLLTAAVQATVRKFNSHLFDLQEFWADNLEKALFAREMAKMSGLDHELAFTGAMLQDFLLPILGQAKLQEYVTYWNDHNGPVSDLIDFELAKFHVHHAQVGAICLINWNVPDELVCGVLCHHMSYQDLVNLGLHESPLRAIAASSLLPGKIAQHRHLAVELSAWDQADDALDLYEVAERVDRELDGEDGQTSSRRLLADRIEDCLVSQLTGGFTAEELQGRHFGSFVLEECIGSGASGAVFLARHHMMNRPAAVKVLSNQDHSNQAIARFEREVQLTSSLKHPNTISIYDFGRTPDGHFYYAMEYIAGLSLKELGQLYGPQPAGRVIHLLRQICGAIEEAHQAGLIHRDIKPENVLLSQQANLNDHVTVVDFGLVKDLADMQGAQDQGITGTPLYLAPESIQETGNSRVSSDLYAIGAVGYYLLTAQPLYTGNSAIDICLKQLSEVPQTPSQRLGKPVPEDLEMLLMRCLDKSPENRPHSARELQTELAKCRDAANWTPEQSSAWWSHYCAEPDHSDSEYSNLMDDPTVISTTDETR